MRRGRDVRAAINSDWLPKLLELDIIAGVNFTQRESDDHRRGVFRRPHDDSLAENFAGNVIPLVILGDCAVAENVESHAPRLIRKFVLRAGITEDPEIISHLD